MTRWLMVALCAALVASPATAKTKKAVDVSAQKRQPIITGKPIEDFENAIKGNSGGGTGGAAATGLQKVLADAFNNLAAPLRDLMTMIGTDDNNAIVLSTLIPTLQDGHGQQCWIGMRSFAAVAKVHPLPVTFQALTDFEAIRLQAMAANDLCGNPHCTQVFADASNMAAAVSPIPIVVPSLNQVCAKVPQVARVPGIVVPADPALGLSPIVPGQNAAAASQVSPAPATQPVTNIPPASTTNPVQSPVPASPSPPDVQQ